MLEQVTSGAAARLAAAAKEQGQFPQRHMAVTRLVRAGCAWSSAAFCAYRSPPGPPAWNEMGSAYDRTGRKAQGQHPEGPLVPLMCTGLSRRGPTCCIGVLPSIRQTLSFDPSNGQGPLEGSCAPAALRRGSLHRQPRRTVGRGLHALHGRMLEPAGAASC